MGRRKGDKNKNKKQKPHARGRPKGSIKQKQHQHQTENVSINTGDEEGKKKKPDFKDYVPSIPNVIFNPSLTIPQGYPIVKPETYPPFYDMNSLLPDYNNIQEPLTKIIKDAIKPPQPVEPIQPVQPVRPVQPTQPIQPVQPVQPVKPKPIKPKPPYQPNPQTINHIQLNNNHHHQ